ncbi:hypothetical protein GCM10009601_32760 [Streptomyces thermospinosisporus]|uniref:GST C-terminal domain-containing protein n=1 Tax=Streptomyces thermospinosisporus TaxID=161482 RepID=A0ABN1YYV8_9ACTN
MSAAAVLTGDAEALAVAAELAADFRKGAAERDARRLLPHAEVERLSQSGLLAVTVPARYGGADVSHQTLAEIFRLLASADASHAQIPQSHFVYINVLRRQGTAQQQEFFFGEVLAGKRFGNAQSEAGTAHVQDIRTRLARRPDASYVLDGVKHYSTGALFAHWIPVLARGDAALAPVLSDDWTGRIVSTLTPGILRDLARHFGGHGPDLLPCGAEQEIEAIGRLCEQGINGAAQRAGAHSGDRAARDLALATLLRALDLLERRLVSGRHLLGGELTLADVQVWVTLVHLDTVHRHHLDAAAVHRVTEHPRLWAYARRLTAHPAFGSRLALDAIARRHHAHCRGEEAAGAAVQIVDWAAHTRAHTRQGAPEPA